MASSSPPPHINGLTLTYEEETPFSTPNFRPVVRRIPPFSPASPSYSSDSSFRSSSSSSISFNEEFHPYSLINSNPLIKFKGVPFSWEQIPGIPKHQCLKKKQPSGHHLLPLPPAGKFNPTAKKLQSQEGIFSPKKLHHHISNRLSLQRDPFFAALVECSKDDDDNGTNNGNIWKGSSKIITKTLSDRFGFINMYTSCRRTCAVSESIVCLPKTTSPHDHYTLYRRRSS